MFSGQWPEPQVGPSRIEEGKLIPVTEAERREKFFEAIEDGHPLVDLIHGCINNDPQLRPHAREIFMRVSRVATQFPASFANRLEMLRRIETVEEQTRVLREEKDVVIRQKEVRIVTLQQETEQKADEIDRLNMAYSSEVEQLKLEVRDLNSQNELLVTRHKAELTEYKHKIEVSDSMRESTEKCLQQEKELGGALTVNLQMKDAVVSGMKEQLTKTREYLTAKQQVSNCVPQSLATMPTSFTYKLLPSNKPNHRLSKIYR
jgi:myosin heavy subunit